MALFATVAQQELILIFASSGNTNIGLATKRSRPVFVFASAFLFFDDYNQLPPFSDKK